MQIYKLCVYKTNYLQTILRFTYIALKFRMLPEDIELANWILGKIATPNSRIFYADIQKRTTNDAQYQRIINSLCKFGAVTKGQYALEQTDSTAIIINQGGAQYIYDKEQETDYYTRLKHKHLQLSIQEQKRNALLSKCALGISFASLLISMLSAVHEFLE